VDPSELADAARGESDALIKRPAVSVVMPFAGERGEASEAAATLRSLKRGPDDEFILADNSGTAGELAEVTVVAAAGERSPAHARNSGAAAATGEWILFIDADCRPRPELIEEYFAQPIGRDVGALAGEVLGIAQAGGADDPSQPPLAARYGAAKSFLSQRQHLAHPYLPRAVAANLLVRRAAFEQVGGFYEGLRAAEDTDFTWRLQRAGWRIELRPHAWVEHRYRTTLSELRRQWRGYAAGRAWLARRYDGFAPESTFSRALGRARRRAGADRTPHGQRQPSPVRLGRAERGKYLAIDAFLALEELAGFMLSNRPAIAQREPTRTEDAPILPQTEGQGETRTAKGAPVVFVADRFPSPGDPLVELPSTLGARVEAAARPQVVSTDSHNLRIRYREDDGLAERLAALMRLCATHPLRCVRDKRRRQATAVSLLELAPAVTRLQHEPEARIQPLGGGEAAGVAQRLQALAGRHVR
jgi:GT2 family glycosyltransferase